MSDGESEDMYNDVTLPITEINALKALEQLLQDNGCLNQGVPIPLVLKDRIERNESKIGFYAENNTVVALSVRYCVLTTLPNSLGQLTHLQQLDLTGNQITSLPETLENLIHLEEIHLDANRLTSLPESIGHLKNL